MAGKQFAEESRLDIEPKFTTPAKKKNVCIFSTNVSTSTKIKASVQS